MQRFIKAVLPCAFGAWAACAALGQTAGNPQAGTAAQSASPGSAKPKGKAAADGHVVPAQRPSFVQPPRAADAAAAKRRMDQLLALWEEKSKEIKTLDAKFSREDYSAAWKEMTYFEGRAILKSPDLAFLDFKKIVAKSKPAVPYEQIRCTGEQVFQYLPERKQIYIYPLAKQERQRALEEGPLPFLFNMKANEASARYEMTLVKEQLEFFTIMIVPRKDIDREAFIRADVLLNRGTFLPNALRLYLPPEGKDWQTYRFTGRDGEDLYIKANVEVNEQNFQGKVLAGWDVVKDPGPGAQQPARVDPRPTNRRPPAVGKAVQGGYPPPRR